MGRSRATMGRQGEEATDSGRRRASRRLRLNGRGHTLVPRPPAAQGPGPHSDSGTCGHSPSTRLPPRPLRTTSSPDQPGARPGHWVSAQPQAAAAQSQDRAHGSRHCPRLPDPLHQPDLDSAPACMPGRATASLAPRQGPDAGPNAASQSLARPTQGNPQHRQQALCGAAHHLPRGRPGQAPSTWASPSASPACAAPSWRPCATQAWGQEATWPLASIKNTDILEIRSTCMQSPAFGYQAHRPCTCSRARGGAGVMHPPPQARFGHLCVPGLSSLALPPPTYSTAHPAADSQRLLSSCCVPGIALGAGE